ncbi:MAG: LptF/LptG family permease [Rectinemataceae bacterium]
MNAAHGDSAGRARKAGFPRLLWRRLILSLLPRFAGGLILFLAIFLLADLFSSLWRFLSLDAPLSGVLAWLGLGILGHLGQVVPVALLFASTYTLAESHASGELMVVFGSGVSLYRYSMPLIALCLALAALGLVFDDAVAVPASNARIGLSRELLKQKAAYSSNDVTLMSDGGRWIYRIAYYDDAGKILNGVEVVGRDEAFTPEKRISADSAQWNGTRWLFRKVRVFTLLPSGDWTETGFAEWSDPALDEKPESFRGIKGDIASMRRKELSDYAGFLESAGLPYAEAAAELQRRYAYALVPLIVGLLSAASGGLFRKNTLLMSLLLSLSVATAYYVAQMLGMLLAKTGAVDPALGAWAPVLFFLAVSGIFFVKART